MRTNQIYGVVSNVNVGIPTLRVDEIRTDVAGFGTHEPPVESGLVAGHDVVKAGVDNALEDINHQSLWAFASEPVLDCSHIPPNQHDWPHP